jgi:CheY-like chemotaxis protein
MTQPEHPRILIVDDEEAILETMTFTFMDVYEVLTATEGARALELLDEKAPVAVVITDQRMPKMTGVELLAQVFERHPDTVRIMLTGFADAESTIQAINDGHVYAYINKPWEPAELKQVVKRAIDHHGLTVENSRLVADLQRANHFLTAVMDRLDVGAVAVDAEGIIQALNRPARSYLRLADQMEGESLRDVLKDHDLKSLSDATEHLGDANRGSFEELDLRTDGAGLRVRVSAQTLVDSDESVLGRVILFKEISHEPLRRCFEEIVGRVCENEGELRGPAEQALAELAGLSERLRESEVASPHMAELGERVSRSQTALQNWLDVDDAMTRESYPDAQLLLDRMRLAARRWPYPDELPERVRALAQRVESYYESGENPRVRVL